MAGVVCVHVISLLLRLSGTKVQALGCFQVLKMISEGIGHSLQQLMPLLQGEFHSQQFSITYVVFLFSG